MYAFNLDLNGDGIGAPTTSFGIVFQTKEEVKENKWSPNVVLLCSSLLRSGMVCEM